MTVNICRLQVDLLSFYVQCFVEHGFRLESHFDYRCNSYSRFQGMSDNVIPVYTFVRSRSWILI